MRAFWEKLGVLGPIYRLVGRGVSDADIANKLNLTEPNVQSYIAWTLHFLRLTNGSERTGSARFAAPPTI